MADERHPSAGHEQGDEGRDGGRRRYFRRRQRPAGRDGGGRDSGRSSNQAHEPDHARARRRGADRRPTENNEPRDPRLGRRRRRARSRVNGNPTQRPDAVLPEVVDLPDYIVPSSVFVYTHVSRAGSGLDTYEFRAEHFSKGGRTLEDFEIDLSKLYPDAAQISTPQNETERDE